MSLLLVTALAVSGPVQAACAWDRPGANPFMGDVVAAVDRYQDIPADVRATLKKRIAARKYDELATIKRDSIAGAYQYADLRDMHFGKGTVCQTVTRDKWTDKTQERGLVYCEDSHCLIVPTICRNVSRVTRVPMKQAHAEGPSGPPEAPLMPFAAGPGELQFEAPAAGAGPSFASTVSGSSPVLPGGSDSGLSYGGADPGRTRDNTWVGSAGLPVIPMPVFGPGVPVASALPNGPTGSPGVPGVPGVTVPPLVPDSPTPGSPGVPGTPGVPGNPEIPGTPGVPAVPGVPGVPEVPVVPTEPGVPGVPTSPPVVPGLPGNPFNPETGGPGPWSPPATPVPEPTTYALMAFGLAFVLWMGRRRSSARQA